MVTPPDIPDLPRVVRSADAPDLGISRRELSGPLWQPVWRGVHLWHDAEKTDPAVRVQAVAPLLPAGAALGAWAALHAQGVHAVDGRIGLTGLTRPILVCVGPVGLIDRRPGLIIDRCRFSVDETSICSGVRVVGAELAICQIARGDGPRRASPLPTLLAELRQRRRSGCEISLPDKRVDVVCQPCD
jgi:hypothetical protein